MNPERRQFLIWTTSSAAAASTGKIVANILYEPEIKTQFAAVKLKAKPLNGVRAFAASGFAIGGIAQILAPKPFDPPEPK